MAPQSVSLFKSFTIVDFKYFCSGTARGARVIILKENPFSFETFIREEGGGIDKQNSHNAGYPHYYTCCSKGDRK